MWHEKRIDVAQRNADASDGRIDRFIRFSEDTVLSNMLTQAILRDVDRLQIMIENLPIDNSGDQSASQLKIRYLTDLNELMRKYAADNSVDPIFWRRTVTNFRELLIARHENRVKDFVLNHADVYTYTNIQLLDGYPESRSYLISVLGRKDPRMMIRKLSDFANEAAADVVVSEAAKVVPNEIFNYATSTNYPLKNAVLRSKDPLVQTIVKISRESKSPLRAMPFLSWVHDNTKTIAEIDKITADQDLFFKSLVQL